VPGDPSAGHFEKDAIMQGHASTPAATKAWQALLHHQQRLTTKPMAQLFAEDSQRASRYLIEAAGLTLDFSKNRLDDGALADLMALAEECQLASRRQALYAGEPVNNTENRPALHTALRASVGQTIRVNGKNVIEEVHATLKQMQQFVNAVTGGERRGCTGERFTDVVSIGIGGSFLGPKLATEALTPYHHGGIRCHYAANIDGTEICEILRQVNPHTTLFLVQSKSFKTPETLENAKVAREWLVQRCPQTDAVAHHFAAVSANVDAAKAFGVEADSLFPMWEWVGGRYSLWSAIGLPVALSIGMDNFRQLLAGAEAMDEHFIQAPLEQNMPVVMAMLGVWYNNLWGACSHAILPYDQYLRSLPDYLQQLDMESNGKRVTRAGVAVTYHTGPIIWGGLGANGQHAYHQLIHQGTRLIPADFIIPLVSHNPIANHHADLFANCLSQSQAMMAGKTLEQARHELIAEGLSAQDIDRLASHKVVPGNQPSNTLIMQQLTPWTLGAMMALYEHRTFVQGVIWDLDSFDQWGVELGKQLGQNILPRLLAQPAPANTGNSDSSTDALIARFRAANGI
jgi:glucose-6-phosphate isomerase